MSFVLENYDYRFFIIDTYALENLMTRNGKQRTKNIIRYFLKNQEPYIELCQNGSLFPIQGINSGEFHFSIDCDMSKNPDWEVLRVYEDQFLFCVNEFSSFWIVAGEKLCNWDHAYFKNNDTMTSIVAGEEYLSAKKLNLHESAYALSISVLKKKFMDQNKVLGFGINFKPIKPQVIFNQLTDFDFSA